MFWLISKYCFATGVSVSIHSTDRPIGAVASGAGHEMAQRCTNCAISIPRSMGTAEMLHYTKTTKHQGCTNAMQ